jgi:hypothetical protein
VAPAVIQLGRQMCLSLNLLEASLYTAGSVPFYGAGGYGRKESGEEENTRKY